MRPLILEDPHATEQASPCTTAIEPVTRGPGATTTEDRMPGAHAPN